ncbi:MAG: hypothetical protein AAF434_01500 [Pseudomonadota bacterium]
MKKFIQLALLPIFLFSCNAESISPNFHYTASFSPSKANVDVVESLVTDVSSNWNLRVVKKDRSQMKLLTEDQEAFFIALYQEEKHVLSITNAGVGTSISMSLYAIDNFSIVQVEQLGREIRDGLLKELSIKFN